jgi:acetyltransferase-like isoleucine patch superfamily enzyme
MAQPVAEFPEVTFLDGVKAQIGKASVLRKGALVDQKAQVRIGAYTFVGHRVMILTGSHDMFKFGPDRMNAAQPRPVTIGDGVWLCSGCIICPGVRIGDHAVVGPGAVVMRNVAPYTVVAGNPARVVRRLRSS